MEFSKRKTVFDSLKKYDSFSNSDNDYIEVTEWTNGEGYDIIISSGTKEQRLSLSYGEYDAIKHCINCLQFSFPDK